MITSESEDPFKIYFPEIGSELLFGNQNTLIRWMWYDNMQEHVWKFDGWNLEIPLLWTSRGEISICNKDHDFPHKIFEQTH